jgi:hypothetical protein
VYCGEPIGQRVRNGACFLTHMRYNKHEMSTKLSSGKITLREKWHLL